METYRTWVRLFDLQRYYSWIVDRFHISTAVIIVGFGALLIYKTWAMAFFATNMFGLVVRARREEQALAAEFPAEWEAYSRRVPAWLPRIRRK